MISILTKNVCGSQVEEIHLVLYIANIDG